MLEFRRFFAPESQPASEGAPETIEEILQREVRELRAVVEALVAMNALDKGSPPGMPANTTA